MQPSNTPKRGGGCGCGGNYNKCNVGVGKRIAYDRIPTTEEGDHHDNYCDDLDEDLGDGIYCHAADEENNVLKKEHSFSTSSSSCRRRQKSSVLSGIAVSVVALAAIIIVPHAFRTACQSPHNGPPSSFSSVSSSSSTHSPSTASPHSSAAIGWTSHASPSSRSHDQQQQHHGSVNDSDFDYDSKTKAMTLADIHPAAFANAGGSKGIIGNGSNKAKVYIDPIDQQDLQSPNSSSFSASLHPSSNYTEQKLDATTTWPRVAWVMSFPNSGTSYTMRLVQKSSNRTAGSNYGKECDVDLITGRNTPIYEHGGGSGGDPSDDENENGPFYSHNNMRRPDRYVPVKTHCGGYTTNSGPDKYVLTVRAFQEKCLTGNVVVPERDPNTGKIVSARGKPNSMVRKIDTIYDANIVQRAVHIVRDPFDNIVSRFHLERHSHTKTKNDEWLERYPSTVDGFQAWCVDLDAKYADEDATSRFVDAEMRRQFKSVPCHGEFHRYVQWHNLALAVTKRMKLPTHVLHYETYESDFNSTFADLFEFLELPSDEGVVPDFIPGKSYEENFSPSQRKEGMELIRMISEPETWDLLGRYDRY